MIPQIHPLEIKMSDINDKPIHIRINSIPNHLSIVRAAVETFCQQLGFDATNSGQVMLSTDEALTNIIRHAYSGAEDEAIEIELTTVNRDGRKALQVSLRDYGKAVGRDEICSRDLKDVRPGGLGVHIMTECMDALDYTHPENGGTLLTMIKNLPFKEKKAQ